MAQGVEAVVAPCSTLALEVVIEVQWDGEEVEVRLCAQRWIWVVQAED